MPNYLHRTTKQLLVSVAESDLPETVANFIIDPVLPAVERRYWNIVGDTVSEMSQAEKDVVDTAQKDVIRDRIAARMDDVEDELRAVVLILIDEINILRSLAGLAPRTPAQAKAGIRSKLGT